MSKRGVFPHAQSFDQLLCVLFSITLDQFGIRGRDPLCTELTLKRRRARTESVVGVSALFEKCGDHVLDCTDILYEKSDFVGKFTVKSLV